MLQEGIEASRILSSKHYINASVLHMASIKPIDREAILEATENTDLIVTVEEHNIFGGLGGAVAEVVSEEAKAKVLRVGIKDKFSGIGTPDYLLDDEGLRANDIVELVLANLK